MTQKDTAYLSMASATLQVLSNNESHWAENKPAARQVTTIRNCYTALNAAQQNADANSTGVTSDKEAAADAAIEKAVQLSGLTQAYAMEEKNNTLYSQVKVNHSMLDNMPDETLTQRLYSLHQHIQAVGQPLEEFGVTGAKLADFEKSIQQFENMKSAPRLVIANRKGHNQTIPENIREMRTAFTILDKLLKNLADNDPVFVRDYFSARQVINRGGRGGGGPETPPAKTDA